MRLKIPHPILSGALALLSFLLVRTSSAATFEVTLANTDFTPTFVQINVGDTVRWTWASGQHTVTSGTPGSPDGVFASSVQSAAGSTFSVTFDAAFLAANPKQNSIYSYFCSVHGAMMTGSIQVANVHPTPTLTPTSTTGSPTSTPTPSAETPTPVPLFISGSVLKGARPLPGVAVVVGNEKTVTNLEGRYLVDALPPATYPVTATKQGFSITAADGTSEIPLTTNVENHDFVAVCSKGFIAKGLACSKPRTPAPPAPKGVQVKVVGTDVQIKFSSSKGATSYRIYRSTTEGEIGAVVTKSGRTTVLDKTTSAGVTYYYLVTALNKKAESAFGKQVTVVR